MAIFALFFSTKGAILDFTLALLYLVLTIACEVLLLDSGVYSSLDYMPYYRGAMWLAAIVWILVSSGRLWFHVTKHSESTLCCTLPNHVNNSFKNASKDTRKKIGMACLWLFVIFTCVPTVFSSVMASVVFCGPNMVEETKNCTIWESTESKRIATGTLLIAQAIIPGILVLIPVGFSFCFLYEICKLDCQDD